MALLPGVLLRDLQLDCLVGVAKGGKQGRDGLAHLEVDGAILDLDHYVAVELAVEGVKVVIAGSGAVGLGVIPVEMIVVDEAAIKHHAAVGLERAGNGVGRLRGGAAVFRRADAAFRIRLDHEAGKVGDGSVDLIHLRPPPGGDAQDPVDRRCAGGPPPGDWKDRQPTTCALPRDETHPRCGRVRGSSPARAYAGRS